VRNAAILVASGIIPAGERQIFGVSVSLSEHETHWKAFLKGLKDRGNRGGVQLVISDDLEGLGAARRAILGSVPWQRCQFHLQQNAQSYVPKQAIRFEVAADIRSLFNAPDKATAEQYLQKATRKSAISAQ
jgi:putative transposase